MTDQRPYLSGRGGNKRIITAVGTEGITTTPPLLVEFLWCLCFWVCLLCLSVVSRESSWFEKTITIRCFHADIIHIWMITSLYHSRKGRRRIGGNNIKQNDLLGHVFFGRRDGLKRIIVYDNHDSMLLLMMMDVIILYMWVVLVFGWDVRFVFVFFCFVFPNWNLCPAAGRGCLVSFARLTKHKNKEEATNFRCLRTKIWSRPPNT
jgi:hypothetical protein